MVEVEVLGYKGASGSDGSWVHQILWEWTVWIDGGKVGVPPPMVEHDAGMFYCPYIPLNIKIIR